MKTFIKTKDVHRVFKREFDKTLKTQGFKRSKGACAAYYIEIYPKRFVGFDIQLSQWGDSWSGNYFYLNCDPDIKDITKAVRGSQLRLTKLFTEEENKAVKKLLKEIIKNKPKPQKEHWIYAEIHKENDRNGFWTESFEKAFSYKDDMIINGQGNSLNYFSEKDIISWTELLSDILPALLKKIVDENIEHTW